MNECGRGMGNMVGSLGSEGSTLYISQILQDVRGK